MSQNHRNQGFTYYICLMIEGSVPRTNGSGSGRPQTYGSNGSESATLSGTTVIFDGMYLVFKMPELRFYIFLMLLFGQYIRILIFFYIFNVLILRVLFVQVLLVKERQVKRVIGHAS